MRSPYKDFVFLLRVYAGISVIKRNSNFGRGYPERQIMFGCNGYIVPLRQGKVSTWKKLSFAKFGFTVL